MLQVRQTPRLGMIENCWRSIHYLFVCFPSVLEVPHHEKKPLKHGIGVGQDRVGPEAALANGAREVEALPVEPGGRFSCTRGRRACRTCWRSNTVVARVTPLLKITKKITPSTPKKIGRGRGVWYLCYYPQVKRFKGLGMLESWIVLGIHNIMLLFFCFTPLDPTLLQKDIKAHRPDFPWNCSGPVVLCNVEKWKKHTILYLTSPVSIHKQD